MRRQKLLAIFLGITCLASASVTVSSSGKAEPLEDQRLYRSPYYLSRGDAGLASADDYEAIFYNPAGLATGEGLYKQTVFVSPTLQLSTETRNLARKIAVEKRNEADIFREHIGKNNNVGFSNFTGIVFRRAAVGLLATTNNNILLAKSPEHSGLEILTARSVSNMAFTFSFAESFFDNRLMVGTTLKLIHQSFAAIEIDVLDSENLGEQLESDDVKRLLKGYGADLGLIWVVPAGRNQLNLGMTVENVGETKLTPTLLEQTPIYLRQTINLGLSYRISSHMSQMLFAVDFRDVTGELSDSYFKRLHIGTEIGVGKIFGLLAGLHQGYPGAGVFANFYLVRVDAGAYTQEIASSAGLRADQRFYVRLMVKI